MKKKVATIQFSVKLNDLQYNQEQVNRLVAKACEDKSLDYILLPETWNLGFFPKEVKEVAEDYSTSTSVALLKQLAKTYQVNIIGGSIIVKDNGLIYNRSLVFNRNGELVHTYDKGHLFSPSNENLEFTKGVQNNVFTLDGVEVAQIICYDLRFPEHIRRFALEGAKLLFISAEWPHPRLNHWQTLSKARAIENQMYVISANGCGVAYELEFCGHSAIIDPWGEIIQEAAEEITILYAEIDVDIVDNVRKRIPVFNDRNINLY